MLLWLRLRLGAIQIHYIRCNPRMLFIACVPYTCIYLQNSVQQYFILIHTNDKLQHKSLEFITAHIFLCTACCIWSGNWLIMSPVSIPLITSSNSLQKPLFMKYVHLQQRFGANHTTPGGRTLACPAGWGGSRGRWSADVCSGKQPAGDVSADSLRTSIIIIIRPSTFTTTLPFPFLSTRVRRIWIKHPPLQQRQSSLLLTRAKQVQCLLHGTIHVYYRPQHQAQTRSRVSANAFISVMLTMRISSLAIAKSCTLPIADWML